VFMYCLFNDAISNSDSLAPKSRMCNELKSMWKEAAVA
jgi:hypothetical protein